MRLGSLSFDRFLDERSHLLYWAMNAVWEPSICSVVAFMRSAIKASALGDIALSLSDTKNHDGIVFQPAAVAFSLKVAAANGRCVT